MIRDARDLKASEKAILWAIASRGECWVSRETLADDAGMSLKTLKRTLSGLVDRGWVEVIPRPGRTNILRVTARPGVKMTRGQIDTPSQNDPPTRGQFDPPTRGQNDPPKETMKVTMKETKKNRTVSFFDSESGGDSSSAEGAGFPSFRGSAPVGDLSHFLQDEEARTADAATRRAAEEAERQERDQRQEEAHREFVSRAERMRTEGPTEDEMVKLAQDVALALAGGDL